jgi:uncharacterized protein YdhG (YjbR/CyaY superfamily)
MADKPATVDALHRRSTSRRSGVLAELRDRIHSVAPDAEETIRYDIPTFKLRGRSFIHLAAWQKHISVYPIPDGDAEFEQQIAPYRSGKGTLKFSLGQPMPYELIERIIALLAAQRS